MAQFNNIDAVLSEPFNQIRKSIADKFLLNQFELKDYEAVIESLEKNLDPKNKFAYYKEKLNLEYTLKHGIAKDLPRLDSLETQILWAAGLALIVQDRQISASWPKENIGAKISDTKIWKQLKDSGAIRAELYRFGHLVHAKAHKNNVKVKYGEPPDGYPNIGYYFDPQQNFVNIDLLWTLIIGYEEARGAVLHELGHAINTVEFSPRMKELATLMMALIGEPGKKPEFKKIVDALNSGKLPKDKRAELKELFNEWQRRHSVFDELENNPINRWVTKQSSLFSQDFGHSLSAIETVAVDVQGDSIFAENKKLVGKKIDEVKASDRLSNLKRAVRMVFHQHNGLFEISDWHKVCVEPELVTSMNDAGPKAFGELLELVGGIKGAEHLIINPSDEWKGKNYFRGRVLELAEARGRIADKIYDDYFAPLYKEQEREQEEPQQSQSGSNNQDEKPPGQNENSEGKDSESEKNDKGKNQEDKPEQNSDEKNGANDNGQQRDEETGQEEGEEQGQGNGKWQNQIDEKRQVESGNEQDNSGDMFDSPVMARAIKKGLGEITPQQIDEELTAEELDDTFQENQKDAAGEAHIPIILPPVDLPQIDSIEAEIPKKVLPTVSKIVKPVHLEDWDNYDEIKQGLGWAIQQMAEKIWQMQRKSYQRSSPTEDPKGIEMREGDLRVVPQRARNSFDMAAHRRLKQLKQQGVQISREDYRRFRDSVPVVSSNRDGGIKKVAQIDVVTMIDGSGSMYMVEDEGNYHYPRGNENSPIEAGITSACIYHEAAKLRRANSFCGLWGSGEGEIIATPDSSADDIKRNIANIRSSRNWGTYLASGFIKMIDVVAKQRATKWDKIGYTHIIIVSDGEIGDSNQAYHAIFDVMEKCKLVTVDFAILTKNSRNEMMQLANRLKADFPDRVEINLITDTGKSVTTLLDLMSRRVIASLEVEAIAKQQKARMLKAGIE